jgi:hypothetical protein
MTHEDYIEAVRQIVVKRLDNQQDIDKLLGTKLMYGVGDGRARGMTRYSTWHCPTNGNKTDEAGCIDTIEICATGEENWTQLAGTTVHELGHVLAGNGAGHSKLWNQACGALGLRAIKAAGTNYLLANFAPDIREQIAGLTSPLDGKPAFFGGGSRLGVCSAGIGTRGGKSRGKGSGSRLRLYVCQCGTKVRCASDTLNATCNECHSNFQLSGKDSTNLLAKLAAAMAA